MWMSAVPNCASLCMTRTPSCCTRTPLLARAHTTTPLTPVQNAAKYNCCAHVVTIYPHSYPFTHTSSIPPPGPPICCCPGVWSAFTIRSNATLRDSRYQKPAQTRPRLTQHHIPGCSNIWLHKMLYVRRAIDIPIHAHIYSLTYTHIVCRCIYLHIDMHIPGTAQADSNHGTGEQWTLQ